MTELDTPRPPRSKVLRLWLIIGSVVAALAILPSVKEPGMPYGLMANEPPTVFCTLRGNLQGANGSYFRGRVAEILCLQTDLPEIRAAVRAYLAAKFAITLPT